MKTSENHETTNTEKHTKTGTQINTNTCTHLHAWYTKIAAEKIKKVCSNGQSRREAGWLSLMHTYTSQCVIILSLQLCLKDMVADMWEGEGLWGGELHSPISSPLPLIYIYIYSQYPPPCPQGTFGVLGCPLIPKVCYCPPCNDLRRPNFLTLTQDDWTFPATHFRLVTVLHTLAILGS